MDGAMALPATPQAEVEEIWPRGGQILIRGAVVGAGDGAGTLIVRARGARDRELRLPTVATGSRFEAQIAVDALAGAGAGTEQIWDLFLALPGEGAELRLGSHLDDIRGKKKIFTYPAQMAAGMWVEPFYTVKDNLSITSRREAS